MRHRINGFSLLYVWRGSDPALAPAIFMAHQDVVPVAQPDVWRHPPFAGVIAGGYIWGRGALDNKSGMVGLLKAVEWLLGRRFKPRRSIYLAFGHDEEVGGRHGAVTQGVVPGITSPVAPVEGPAFALLACTRSAGRMDWWCRHTWWSAPPTRVTIGH